jgi:hypothetical protein
MNTLSIFLLFYAVPCILCHILHDMFLSPKHNRDWFKTYKDISEDKIRMVKEFYSMLYSNSIKTLYYIPTFNIIIMITYIDIEIRSLMAKKGI